MNSFYGFSIDLENVFCHNLLSKTFTKVNEFTSKLEHFSKNSPRVCERVNTYSQADEAKGLTNTNSLDTVRQIGCLPQN